MYSNTTLHIIPRLGLCNRLRAIASGVEVGRRLGARTVVHWNRVDNFYARFGELFEPVTVEGVQVEEVRGLLNAIPKRHNAFLPKLLQWVRYGQVIYLHSCDKDVPLLPRIRPVRHVLVVSAYSVGPHYPMTQLFRPIALLREQVEACTARFGARTIGLHIRGTDHPLSRVHSTVDKFIGRIDAEIATDPEVTFFLATDETSARQTLVDRYGQRIIWRENVLNRTSVEGIQDAVVDLFCLCRTSQIVGSYGSSFSEIAAELGGIPLDICM